MSHNPFRLPRHTRPDHYDIRLELDLETFTFTGSVGIDIEVTEATDALVLNAAEVEIKSAALSDGTVITEIAYDDEMQRAILSLGSALEPGSHRLEIEHSGIINDQLRGLYRSVYRDAEGNEHPLATSQCQATDARRVFPCWDEPDFKATYQTTMVVADGLEAYSNTAELERVKLDDGRLEFRFDKTMKMSTYLLAFIAGPFEATEPRVVRGTPIRIIVPMGNLHLTDIAMENAVFCFEYLSDYYGIPYPADKLDHIGIPDFAAGAMENVGLITYRDAYLVIDPEKASQSELQNSLDVIGHEIAHQWFGNLVTMAWWEGAWLNEAFASFMELKATDAMRPEWKRWLAFANLEVPWAMGTDQLVSTRPIEFEVTSPEEVDQMFDAITYGKGSAVLHMIDEFVGVENFRQGVGNYLRKHSYANTVTTDLWEGLDSASEYPVSEIMDTWVYQRGFPQIDVKVVDGGVRLSQRRYLVIPDETDTTIWKVPVQLRGSAGGASFQIKFLLEEDEAVVPIEGTVDWVVANAGGHGFYRTRYSDDLFDALLTHVEGLGDIERYTLVSDTLGFVRNGQLPVTAFLDLAAKFGDEAEQAIWSIITGGLGLVEHHALEDEAREGFERFVTELVSPAMERLGWEPRDSDSDLERKLRGELIATLGNLARDERVIDRCRSLAADVLDGENFDPEVCTAALAVYARNGDSEEHSRLWTAYKEATTPLEQVRFLRSVSAVESESQAIDTLDKVVDGDIRTQDGFWVFARLLMGEAGPEVWANARSRWDEVLGVMPGMTRTRVVEGLPALSQPEVAADIKGFFAEHPLPEASRALEQKLELLDANVKLRERETPAVTEYFSNRVP
ncbi:MAG TPA: M1 family metallopeptidase [Acidimicrobiia bacterium]|nr:M1 family metallopeptidase [Acidimicrobiia bacterium]